MIKRIFYSICLVGMIVLAAVMTIVLSAMYNYYTTVQQSQLKNQTILASRVLAAEGADYLLNLEELDCRITLIGSDGAVLYDNRSEHQEMENHLAREEIQEALKTGYGESSRYSATLMERSFYCAKRLPDGSVLRLSCAQHSIVTLLFGVSQSIALVLLVAIGFSLWLAYRLAQNIVKPLNQMDFENPLANEGYEELMPLLRRLESQQRQLKGQQQELKRKQREFDTVTNHMDEGLVLLNARCHVLTMNQAAARQMGLLRPYVGINFLSICRIPAMTEVVNQALAGHRGAATVHDAGRDYQLEANPVKTGGEVSGVVVLLLDITPKQQAENQRREFTANVSHELKTPLHVISGYAELMKSGLVQPGDVGAFADKIYTETHRLIRLVEDILRLSRLDEGALQAKPEPVALLPVIHEALKELAHHAQRAQVTLAVEGESATVPGVPQQISGIITNLCSNAIKYNRPGGKVTVSLEEQDSYVVLTVADTGIGIAPEHQERIFERFYRVDKSHSKAVGGTGLGLSIVKHAAMAMNARIDLQSQPDVGTTVRVSFPK